MRHKIVFTSDLHGNETKYKKLVKYAEKVKADSVIIGGDIAPNVPSKSLGDDTYIKAQRKFLEEELPKLLTPLKKRLPSCNLFLIMGNDDCAINSDVLEENSDLFQVIHGKRMKISKDFDIVGYSCVPISPFLIKDWEKYDVSRYVDPGCIPPEEGFHSTNITKNEILYSTIKQDLIQLKGNDDLSNAIFLFHSPPYKTNLDRAALDGKFIDYVPLDVHIGSIAIQRFIEDYQPLITLHGHVHESASITGYWSDTIGKTHCFSAAHNDKELAIVKFNPLQPDKAIRILI